MIIAASEEDDEIYCLPLAPIFDSIEQYMVSRSGVEMPSGSSPSQEKRPIDLQDQGTRIIGPGLKQGTTHTDYTLNKINTKEQDAFHHETVADHDSYNSYMTPELEPSKANDREQTWQLSSSERIAPAEIEASSHIERSKLSVDDKSVLSGRIRRLVTTAEENTIFPQGVELSALVELGYAFTYDVDGKVEIHAELDNNAVQAINDKTLEVRNLKSKAQCGRSRSVVTSTMGLPIGRQSGDAINNIPNARRATVITATTSSRSLASDMSNPETKTTNEPYDEQERGIAKDATMIGQGEGLQDKAASREERQSYEQILKERLLKLGKLLNYVFTVG